MPDLYEFPKKGPGETKLYGFDFTSKLNSANGEAITGTPTFTCTTYGLDYDPSPSSMISGSAVISGKAVTQLITGGILGNTYLITCSLTTNKGQTFTPSAIIKIDNTSNKG